MTAAGGFLQTTLRHSSNRSGIPLMVSIDTYRRNDVLREARNTLPVDFHHNLAWANRRQLIGGFACQNSDSDSYGSVSASLGTASLNMKNFSEALNASTSRRVRSWNEAALWAQQDCCRNLFNLSVN
jgi:hypothetical protein